jgi:hypothetical protein
MILSQEQQNTVIRFMNEKWGLVSPVCSMCGRNQLNVADRVFELREFNGGNLVVGGEASICPVIPVTCANCGHIVFVNAIAAGIVQANPIPEQRT